MFTSKGLSVRRWVLHRICSPEPYACQITAILSALTVLPGLSQALPGDAGHPVRPQEAAGSPPAVRQGFLSGGQLCQRRHPVHHHQVHHRDRETGAQDEGEKVGLWVWVLDYRSFERDVLPPCRVSTGSMGSRPVWRSCVRPLKMERSWWSCPSVHHMTSAMSSSCISDR